MPSGKSPLNATVGGGKEQLLCTSPVGETVLAQTPQRITANQPYGRRAIGGTPEETASCAPSLCHLVFRGRLPPIMEALFRATATPAWGDSRLGQKPKATLRVLFSSQSEPLLHRRQVASLPVVPPCVRRGDKLIGVPRQPHPPSAWV